MVGDGAGRGARFLVLVGGRGAAGNGGRGVGNMIQKVHTAVYS